MLKMNATFQNEDGSTADYQDEQAWLMLQARAKPYAGAPQLKQLPATKEKYSGKNPAGGRKAIFSQAQTYKRNPRTYDDDITLDSGVISVAVPWYGWANIMIAIEGRS